MNLKPNSIQYFGTKKFDAAISLEGCCILSETVHRASLPSHTLHQHPNCHSARERVWVDDHVGLHPALSERHIHCRPFLGTNALLTVSRREFVAYGWGTGDAKRDVDLL